MRRYIVAVTVALAAVSAGAVLAPAGVARVSARGHAHRASHTFSFYARVVRSNAAGLVVRTMDGRTLTFSASQIRSKPSPNNPHKPAKHKKHPGRPKHHKGHKGSLRAAGDTGTSLGTVTVSIVGLQPGVTVLITETVDEDGNITITITLPPPAGKQNASGVVTDVGEHHFEVTTGDGSVLHLQMAEQALSDLNLQTCDTVDVTYHQDSGVLIADSVKVTGASTSGDCAPTYDATGTISQVSDSSLTISTDQGPVTFSVADPDLVEGFGAGDLVDVTYTKGDDGSLDATNVEYVEQEANGVVTAVSAHSVTIDEGDGHSETFTADPNQGLQIYTNAFDGVKVGDQIDLTYHQAAGKFVADTVTDSSSHT
jgi:hypothetical protein